MSRFQLLIFALIISVVSYAQSLPGDYFKEMQIETSMRSYLLHFPAGFDIAKKYPLVIVLHDNSSNATQIMQQSGFNAYANQNSFIVVYPNGTGLNNFSWILDTEAKNNNENIVFIDHIVSDLLTSKRILKDKIYLCGINNGANMAYKYACESKTAIKALALIGSISYIPSSKANYALKTIHIRDSIFTKIAVVKSSKKKRKKNEVEEVSVNSFITSWAVSNHCKSEPILIKNDEQLIASYYNDEKVEMVRAVLLKQLLTSWPGSGVGYRISDRQTHVYNATDEIWKFWTSNSN